VRFSLQDVKRQVRRRDGELALALHFLRAGELREEIARLVAYHEQRCGLPRKSFARDEASALVGDYRLAGCLLATLSSWYVWQPPAWDEAVSASGELARVALDEAGLRSPVALRLELFNYVNAQYAGFLDTNERSAALETFAARYGLATDRLDALLALDSEDAMVLTRVSVESPSPDEVAGLYNQWVFEAALFNSSEVRFTIDCEAFLAVQREASEGAVTGLGAVIKRLCFLARKLGVYYDLAYGQSVAEGANTTLLYLTLYGPQEMTGSPQQYGQRLARLCRMLLGYGLRAASSGSGGSKRQSSVALSKALRQAEASVHLFQQSYRFSMDAGLLALLPIVEQERAAGRVAESASIYDSGIEQAFAEAFAALERAQGTDGWRLEREPEPLLLPRGAGESFAGIVIPDFALTRGSRRINIEILGFWTPAYRERKLQKLQQLRGSVEMVLALPVEAHQSFAALAPDYPLIEYRDQLSASEVLRVMQARYDDFAERLARFDVARARTTVQAANFVPERTCYELFGCYRRAELAQAADRVVVPGEIVYTPGIGLYTLAWLEHLHHSFVEWVEAQNCVEWSLSVIIPQCVARWPELAGCNDATIEALLARWPEVEIRHDSIFEATLLVTALRDAVVATMQSDAEEAPDELAQPAPRKVVRTRRVVSKKRVTQETSQKDLWE
jgi:predicted nuclease of restriction endonuclease-like RecB superfamily